jgi:hypothetical protein
MIEHYFVIKYTNEGGWEWDVDTESARFDDSTIYYTDTEDWVPAHLGEGEYVDNDDDVSDQLSAILQIANEARGIGL